VHHLYSFLLFNTFNPSKRKSHCNHH